MTTCLMRLPCSCRRAATQAPQPLKTTFWPCLPQRLSPRLVQASELPHLHHANPPLIARLWTPQMSSGKGHACFITDKGQLYSLGLHRADSAADADSAPAAVHDAPHSMATEKCMICVSCFHCTGFGPGCCMTENQRPRPDKASSRPTCSRAASPTATSVLGSLPPASPPGWQRVRLR